jgi:hypothetical protein
LLSSPENGRYFTQMAVHRTNRKVSRQTERITEFFGKKAASKKLCPFAFRRYVHPDRGSMTPTGARSGVPKNNGLLSIANHLGMVISRPTISFTLN